MKILTILGARPQFIKAFPLSAEFKSRGVEEYILHTGQHYSDNMSQIFFDELGLQIPYKNLNVGSSSHASQTADVMLGVEAEIEKLKPDFVIVYGDTNSTLGAALAVCKTPFRLVHIEAGLRSFNKSMPEEHNRIVTDHISDVLFCPSESAVNQLKKENIIDNAYNVGDLMFDSVRLLQPKLMTRETLGKSYDYALLTLHRPYNVDNEENVLNILSGVNELGIQVLFPIHPRTLNNIQENYKIDLDNYMNIEFMEPLGYIQMMSLLKYAKICITDSGGLQKEAYYSGIPCLTLRPETEWTELLDIGVNVLVNPNEKDIVKAYAKMVNAEIGNEQPYGDGFTANKICNTLEKLLV